MNPTMAAVRAGLRRGVIELRNTFSNGQDLWNYFFPTAALLVTMFFMRGSTVPGTSFSLGARTLPSALGMGLAFGGMLVLASQLVMEREDGTLLRAKATPNGMLGYLIGKITLMSTVALVSMLLQLVPALFFLDGLQITSASAWFTLLWVAVLGLVATLPMGAVLGSLIENPRNLGLIMLPNMGLIALSGIFYPINGYPGWLQAVAQVFPIYWLGLGMRSALLPDSMAAVELGGSWRHLETLGVLAAWAVLGLLLAPVVLRRMARRESGSRVAARRERAMQRVG
ncbi:MULTISPECIES: ABC transporter permease [Micromonospora]|uniref:ABC transporter permease n=1 Tax=Micromonospora solifontis TaxID=2487138 RepID=A0ABX9W9P2_9ACTN|nr:MULTISPECIES: ABC transporter permease [Micromonospora]NES16607.1 ABC transporter permease [Micromonospora sp. PPF5-17B]NES39242.1 ABC transporter permease [Micromonospora solifontis]NES58386.1 ABC transporter permease [Micromonospora sp. PPF5-6]RNL89827.1 ABC transporter permease [Micromonospora solifontis]